MRPCLALAVFLVLAPGLAGAADRDGPAGAPAGGPIDIAGVSGSLRSAYWSSDRRLDDREHFPVTALWLRSAARIGRDAALVVDGWVGNEDLFRADRTRGALREAYLELSRGPWDFRIGTQIIAWGRADRINPTDVLTPRDYTLLVPADDDQRLGAPAVKATYNFAGGLALTGVALPVFEPTTIAIAPFPPTVRLRERSPRAPVSQWALKLERTGGGIDWSVSYYDGFDLLPDLGIDRRAPDGLDLLLQHHRIRMLGADAATSLGRYGLRAEAAYTFTEDPSGTNPFVRNPFFFLVLGVDRTIADDYSVNLQYLVRVIANFVPTSAETDGVRRSVAIQEAVLTNQLDAVQHSAALRLNGRWLNQTLEAETTLVLSLTRLDYAIRPKLVYALTDRWRVTVGADIFRGEFPSLFGRLRANTGAYAELRWSF